MREQCEPNTVVFQPVVGAQPDAVTEAVHLATPLTSAAARTVALILGALRFRTEERDVREGTVATVLAAKQQGFADTLQHSEGLGALIGILHPLYELCTPSAQ